MTNVTRHAVLRTLRKAARIGGDTFATAHGFRSGKYVVRWRGLSLPSKAVLGVAAGRGASTFSGGIAHAVRVLRRLGFKVIRVVTIALIACSMMKRATASAARDLYRGDLFRKAVAYAQAKLDGFAILSARHGLVDPDAVIEPYDQRLPGGKRARASWEATVLADLRNQFAEGTVFVLLCGRDYRGAIEASDLDTKTPLAGLRGLGDMKHWLASRS